MDITLDMDEEIVRRVSKIASDRGTTLTAMVRDYLRSVIESDAARREAASKFRESVERYSRDMGPRTWTRDDLYDRPKRFYRQGFLRQHRLGAWGQPTATPSEGTDLPH